MTSYFVRSVLEIDAADPVDAAEQFKDQLASVPLEEWVYRVEDRDENMFYVYKGIAYTLEKLQEHLLPPEEVERIRAAQASAEEG